MKLNAIRFFETIFLFFVIAFQLEIYPEVVFDFNISFSLNFIIRFGPAAEGVVLSTAFFGYLLSFVGTLQQRAGVRKGLWITSMALSLLGMITYINEFVRVISAYDFAFVFHIPLVLVILDWKIRSAYVASWLKKDTSTAS